MKAIIIGSGIAGLTAAAALTHEGFEVTVFEQHHRPGGWLRQSKKTVSNGTWAS